MKPTTYVAEHAAAIVEDTLDLLAIDTQNPPGRTRPAIDYLDEAFGTLDVETERVAVNQAKPNLLARLPGERDVTLLYNGHLDTVPFDREDWSYDPLGERVGDRLYGRGATDMKGAVASMLGAARAFVETGTTPPVDLAFTFVSDEEVRGDAGLPAVLSAGIEADACLIGESTCEAGRHSVTVADRGAIWLTLEATGEGAHGSRPVLGENAIDRLYHGIETIREECGSRTLDIEPGVGTIIEESIAYYEPLMGEVDARELFAYPSVNLGTIEGGTAVNAVPETARAQIDIRLAPGVHTPDVIDDVRSCLESIAGVAVTGVSWSVGTHLDLDGAIVSATTDVAEAATGERVYRRSATGGGDAKILRNAGIPAVEFALGTATVHAVDEYTTVDILQQNTQVFVQLPEAYAAARGG